MEPVEKKVRVFVALDVPPEWKAALGELQRELKRDLRSNAFRWVNPEQIHLTLRFFGSIAPEEAAQVSGILDRIAATTPKLNLTAQSFGCFPNPRRARVLWAGLVGQTLELGELQRQIGQSTFNIGEPPDDRGFSPHLTLARIKEARPHDLRALPPIVARSFSLPAFQVSQIHLMRSHLSSGGARYEVVSEHRFGQAS